MLRSLSTFDDNNEVVEKDSLSYVPLESMLSVAGSVPLQRAGTCVVVSIIRKLLADSLSYVLYQEC